VLRRAAVLFDMHAQKLQGIAFNLPGQQQSVVQPTSVAGLPALCRLVLLPRGVDLLDAAR
jgi:hypothetical protein